RDAGAAGGMLESGTSGQSENAMLCRRIGGAPGKRVAAQSVDGGVVHNHAAAVLEHEGNFVSHAEKDGREIAVDRLAPRVLGGAGHGCRPAAAAAVIEGIVEPPVLALDGLDELLDSCTVRHVASDPRH